MTVDNTADNRPRSRFGSPYGLDETVTERTSTEEVVLRSLGGRLLRGVAVTVGSVAPVGLLAFAVRQEFDPIVSADKAAIRASSIFSRTHGLTSVLLAVQHASRPVVVYSACTV